MQTTLTIDANKLKPFLKRVVQMQNKALKLGFAPIVLVSTGQPRERQATMTVVEGRGSLGATKCEVLVSEVDVVLEGTLPVFNGWTVLGRIDHTPEGNLWIGRENVLTPKELRNALGTCQHCNQDRNRSKTYLISNSTSIMQVGGSCLKDYTRSEKPEQEFNYGVELVAFLGGEEFEVDPSSGVQGTDIVQLLGTAIAIVERSGYVTVRDAEYDGMISTKEATLSALRDKDNHFAATVENWDKYDNEAKRLIEWAKAQEPESTYMQNAHVLLSNEIVSDRYAGLLISLVAAKRKADARAAREAHEATATNEHVGEPGLRLRGLQLTIQTLHIFEGYYGSTTMFIMRDQDGRAYKWMASGACHSINGKFVEQGDTITLDGTVKEHSEYEGTKQTVLTRCKIKVKEAV
jgi:uncharacterized protein YdcH (DUF465 family)